MIPCPLYTVIFDPRSLHNMKRIVPVAEENANAQNEAPQEQFGIQKLYLKDVSFEAPNSPHIFTEQVEPNVELQLSNEVNALAQDVYEIVLKVTVTAKTEDKTAFLVEVQQAGIFAISGFDDARLSYMLNSYCPNILFPYVREAISGLVINGGFQPLLLAPVNFDALYQQQMEQQQQQQEAAPASDATH